MVNLHTSTLWFLSLPDMWFSGISRDPHEGIGRHRRQGPQPFGNRHLVTALSSTVNDAGCQIPVRKLGRKASNWNPFQAGVFFHDIFLNITPHSQVWPSLLSPLEGSYHIFYLVFEEPTGSLSPIRKTLNICYFK